MKTTATPNDLSDYKRAAEIAYTISASFDELHDVLSPHGGDSMDALICLDSLTDMGLDFFFIVVQLLDALASGKEPKYGYIDAD